MGRGPKRGRFSRTRDLAAFNKKFSPNILEKTIKSKLKNNQKVNVLEIGCGEGRVLMQLRKLFPNIELHGINKKPWIAMRGSSSLKTTGTHYKIFTPSEVKKVKLPTIHFTDAKKLKFKDKYFDLIYSQVAIQYVDRKDQLLEEVWRVLKPGGKAFLNIDARTENVPDFLDFTTPRFIIYKDNKIYPLKSFIKDINKSGFDIKYKTSVEKEKGETKKRINLVITKNINKKLNLNLKFDEPSSFNLNVLNEEKNRWSMYWGYRSVYKLFRPRRKASGT